MGLPEGSSLYAQNPLQCGILEISLPCLHFSSEQSPEGQKPRTSLRNTFESIMGNLLSLGFEVSGLGFKVSGQNLEAQSADTLGRNPRKPLKLLLGKPTTREPCVQTVTGKNAPRCHPDDPKTTQEPPRTLQDAPRTLQDAWEHGQEPSKNDGF